MRALALDQADQHLRACREWAAKRKISSSRIGRGHQQDEQRQRPASTASRARASRRPDSLRAMAATIPKFMVGAMAGAAMLGLARESAGVAHARYPDVHHPGHCRRHHRIPAGFLDRAICW